MAKKNMPSLIIVDFIMPKMNGFQFCKNIRSDSALNNVPIVLITSKGEDVGKGFDKKFGIVQYLQKPFETETLTKTVEEALAGKKEKPEVVSEETAAEKVLQTPSGKNPVPEDLPFVKITAAENRQTDDHAAKALPSEAPADAPSAKDEPVAPVYAVLQENIKKEFRHYFGRELAVLLKKTIIQSLKETDLVRSSRRILSGEIIYISVNDILKFIRESRLSGRLTVMAYNFNSEIYLQDGQIAFASISRHDCRTCLEELVAKNGNPRKGEILSALSEAGGNSLTAGSILLDRGLLTEDELTGHYRRLSEDALNQTLSAVSGHFYFEDVPLPGELQNIKLQMQADGAGV
jgi:CheY-like chemotaxis protein